LLVEDDFTTLAYKSCQNPQNWSSARKAWVMFQTCLLTLAIYLGSAIYTAGIPYITTEFHVSTVAATVGLTAFVAGYGLGKSKRISYLALFIYLRHQDRWFGHR
jgi:hypothetical protein